MLTGLGLLQGRTVVLFEPQDAPARARAEAYLRAWPALSVQVASPRDLANCDGECGAVAIFCSDTSKHLTLDLALLAQCLAKLRAGGYVLAWIDGVPAAEAAALETTGLFAGAVNSRVLSRTDSGGGRCAVAFACSKPAWAAGEAAALPGASVATINEDELLEDVPAPQGKGKSDCSTQPKACANCSCGRKELEDKLGAEEAKTRLEQGKERSACGSCYLGDAFRCETCPYRGLPAFKPGAKVSLVDGETEGSGQLGMRVEAVEEQERAAGGKVVISLA